MIIVKIGMVSSQSLEQIMMTIFTEQVKKTIGTGRLYAFSFGDEGHIHNTAGVTLLLVVKGMIIFRQRWK